MNLIDCNINFIIFFIYRWKKSTKKASKLCNTRSHHSKKDENYNNAKPKKRVPMNLTCNLGVG